MAFGHFAERRTHHPALGVNTFVDGQPPADKGSQTTDEGEKKEAVVDEIKAKIIEFLQRNKSNFSVKGLAHTLYGSIDGNPEAEPSNTFYLAIQELLESEEIISNGGDLISLGTVRDHRGRKGKTVGRRISRHIATRH